MAELNEAMNNNYIEGAFDARWSILKSDHSAPSGGTLNFSNNADFGTSDLHLCGPMFLKNCMAEFNQTKQNNYIESVVRFLKSDHSVLSNGNLNLSKNFGISGILALQTFIYWDQGF